MNNGNDTLHILADFVLENPALRTMKLDITKSLGLDGTHGGTRKTVSGQTWETWKLIGKIETGELTEAHFK